MDPDKFSTIDDVVAAISKRPRGAALLVVGYFNTDLAAPDGRERDKDIAAALAEEGLEDMIGQFLPRHKPWLKDGCTWDMHRGVWEVRSWTDYILGAESRLFQSVAVWDVRHDTDR